MTDEEIKEMEKEAKEYSQGNFYLEQGFLYGYERGFAEGKPKWHDLRKDPNDLPKELGHYLTDDGNTYIYSPVYRKWRTLTCMTCWEFDWLDDGDIIAWCELPKFKE